ncbi:DUF4467 domain-containing protein [Bacillus pseudomycoides]
MKRIIAILSVGAVALMSGCTNTHDSEIEKVLSLETAEIKDAKKDIDKVERSKTCTKVYQDGKIIEIAYKIRKDHTKETFYIKSGETYKWLPYYATKEKLKTDERPVYEENCE